MANVFFIVDHPITLFGLDALIAAAPEFDCVGHATNGADGVTEAQRLGPDIALIDLSQADEAVDVTRQLKRRLPGAALVALTERKARRHLEAMIAAGVLGYVLKSSAGSDLLRAFRVVASGNAYLDPGVAENVVAAAGRPWHAAAR